MTLVDAKLEEPAFTLTDNRNGQSWDLPIRSGTLGPDVLDIRRLYADAGIFTFDPGYTSTASCESAITFIDGEEGVLLYRGYPIEQLAVKSDYLEVCYLLLNGELPTKAEKASKELFDGKGGSFGIGAPDTMIASAC